MSPPALQDIITRLAALSGAPVPDIAGQPPLMTAAAEVHLTREALSTGATWAQVADARGMASGVLAKRYHGRLERAVRRELAMRANAGAN